MTGSDDLVQAARGDLEDQPVDGHAPQEWMRFQARDLGANTRLQVREGAELDVDGGGRRVGHVGQPIAKRPLVGAVQPAPAVLDQDDLVRAKQLLAHDE